MASVEDIYASLNNADVGGVQDVGLGVLRPKPKANPLGVVGDVGVAIGKGIWEDVKSLPHIVPAIAPIGRGGALGVVDPGATEEEREVRRRAIANWVSMGAGYGLAKVVAMPAISAGIKATPALNFFLGGTRRALATSGAMENVLYSSIMHKKGEDMNLFMDAAIGAGANVGLHEVFSRILGKVGGKGKAGQNLLEDLEAREAKETSGDWLADLHAALREEGVTFDETPELSGQNTPVIRQELEAQARAEQMELFPPGEYLGAAVDADGNINMAGAARRGMPGEVMPGEQMDLFGPQAAEQMDLFGPQAAVPEPAIVRPDAVGEQMELFPGQQTELRFPPAPEPEAPRTPMRGDPAQEELFPQLYPPAGMPRAEQVPDVVRQYIERTGMKGARAFAAAVKVIRQQQLLDDPNNTGWIDDYLRRAARVVEGEPKSLFDIVKGEFLSPSRQRAKDMLWAEVNNNPAFSDDNARRAFASAVLKREVDSFSALTPDESLQVTNVMRALRGEVPLAPRADVTVPMIRVRTPDGPAIASLPDRVHATLYDIGKQGDKFDLKKLDNHVAEELEYSLDIDKEHIPYIGALYKFHVDRAAKYLGPGQHVMPTLDEFLEAFPATVNHTKNQTLATLTERIAAGEAERAGATRGRVRGSGRGGAQPTSNDRVAQGRGPQGRVARGESPNVQTPVQVAEEGERIRQASRAGAAAASGAGEPAAAGQTAAAGGGGVPPGSAAQTLQLTKEGYVIGESGLLYDKEGNPVVDVATGRQAVATAEEMGFEDTPSVSFTNYVPEGMTAGTKAVVKREIKLPDGTLTFKYSTIQGDAWTRALDDLLHQRASAGDKRAIEILMARALDDEELPPHVAKAIMDKFKAEWDTLDEGLRKRLIALAKKEDIDVSGLTEASDRVLPGERGERGAKPGKPGAKPKPSKEPKPRELYLSMMYDKHKQYLDELVKDLEAKVQAESPEVAGLMERIAQLRENATKSRAAVDDLVNETFTFSQQAKLDKLNQRTVGRIQAALDALRKRYNELLETEDFQYRGSAARKAHKAKLEAHEKKRPVKSVTEVDEELKRSKYLWDRKNRPEYVFGLKRAEADAAAKIKFEAEQLEFDKAIVDAQQQAAAISEQAKAKIEGKDPALKTPEDKAADAALMEQVNAAEAKVRELRNEKARRGKAPLTWEQEEQAIVAEMERQLAATQKQWDDWNSELKAIEASAPPNFAQLGAEAGTDADKALRQELREMPGRIRDMKKRLERAQNWVENESNLAKRRFAEREARGPRRDRLKTEAQKAMDDLKAAEEELAKSNYGQLKQALEKAEGSLAVVERERAVKRAAPRPKRFVKLPELNWQRSSASGPGDSGVYSTVHLLEVKVRDRVKADDGTVTWVERIEQALVRINARHYGQGNYGLEIKFEEGNRADWLPTSSSMVTYEAVPGSNRKRRVVRPQTKETRRKWEQATNLLQQHIASLVHEHGAKSIRAPRPGDVSVEALDMKELLDLFSSEAPHWIQGDMRYKGVLKGGLIRSQDGAFYGIRKDFPMLEDASRNALRPLRDRVASLEKSARILVYKYASENGIIVDRWGNPKSINEEIEKILNQQARAYKHYKATGDDSMLQKMELKIKLLKDALTETESVKAISGPGVTAETPAINQEVVGTFRELMEMAEEMGQMYVPDAQGDGKVIHSLSSVFKGIPVPQRSVASLYGLKPTKLVLDNMRVEQMISDGILSRDMKELNLTGGVDEAGRPMPNKEKKEKRVVMIVPMPDGKFLKVQVLKVTKVEAKKVSYATYASARGDDTIERASTMTPQQKEEAVKKLSDALKLGIKRKEYIIEVQAFPEWDQAKVQVSARVDRPAAPAGPAPPPSGALQALGAFLKGETPPAGGATPPPGGTTPPPPDAPPTGGTPAPVPPPAPAGAPAGSALGALNKFLAGEQPPPPDAGGTPAVTSPPPPTSGGGAAVAPQDSPKAPTHINERGEDVVEVSPTDETPEYTWNTPVSVGDGTTVTLRDIQSMIDANLVKVSDINEPILNALRYVKGQSRISQNLARNLGKVEVVATEAPNPAPAAAAPPVDATPTTPAPAPAPKPAEATQAQPANHAGPRLAAFRHRRTGEIIHAPVGNPHSMAHGPLMVWLEDEQGRFFNMFRDFDSKGFVDAATGKYTPSEAFDLPEKRDKRKSTPEDRKNLQTLRAKYLKVEEEFNALRRFFTNKGKTSEGKLKTGFKTKHYGVNADKYYNAGVYRRFQEMAKAVYSAADDYDSFDVPLPSWVESFMELYETIPQELKAGGDPSDPKTAMIVALQSRKEIVEFGKNGFGRTGKGKAGPGVQALQVVLDKSNHPIGWQVDPSGYSHPTVFQMQAAMTDLVEFAYKALKADSPDGVMYVDGPKTNVRQHVIEHDFYNAVDRWARLIKHYQEDARIIQNMSAEELANVGVSKDSYPLLEDAIRSKTDLINAFAELYTALRKSGEDDGSAFADLITKMKPAADPEYRAITIAKLAAEKKRSRNSKERVQKRDAKDARSSGPGTMDVGPKYGG